jgi:hypothetical protein
MRAGGTDAFSFVLLDPLTYSVVRDPIPTSCGSVTESSYLSEQMRVGRAIHLSSRRTGTGLTPASNSTMTRAVALLCVGWPEPLITCQASARIAFETILSAAVCVERGCTVRAYDPQVLKSVVVGDAVYMVQDERHPATHPSLALTTKLTAPSLDPFLEQASLKVSTGVGRTLDEDLIERPSASTECATPTVIWIKVVCGDLPDRLGVLAQRKVIATRWAHPQLPQRFRITARRSYCVSSFALGVSRSFRWHEHMFSYMGDVLLRDVQHASSRPCCGSTLVACVSPDHPAT